MSLDLESKALSEFTKVLSNNTTKKNYLYHLNKYLVWSNKNPDQAISQAVREIQTSLENYCEWLKSQNHSKSYQRLAFASLCLFFGMNYKEVNKTRLRKMISPQEGMQGGIAYETEDIKKILEAIDKTKITKKGKRYTIKTQLRSRALVHFLAASGVRVGAVSRIRFKDLEKIEGCYCIKVYGGSMYEHLTFLTPEATRALDDYIKTRDFEKEKEVSKAWRGTVLPKDEMRIFFMSYHSVRLCLNRIVRRAKLQEIKQGKRYEKPTAHAFRKRWNTILKSNKDINSNLIEVMIGHTHINLDKHYLKPTRERLFEEFKKGIDDLTIYKIL